MKKTHSSHTIFIFLGMLVLLFIFLFSFQYFESEYLFSEGKTTTQSQSYDEGEKLYNPFTTNIEGDISLNEKYNWVRFESNKISFDYPDIFSLKIHNATMIEILPPLSLLEQVECENKECIGIMTPSIIINSGEIRGDEIYDVYKVHISEKENSTHILYYGDDNLPLNSLAILTYTEQEELVKEIGKTIRVK